MKAVSEFFSRVIPMATGCPEPVAEQAIVDSAIDFCEKTLALRYQSDALFAVSGISTYDIEVPTYHALSRIIHAKIGDQELQAMPVEQLPTERDYSAQPVKFYVTQGQFERQLNLYPTPDASYTVNMTLAIRPLRGTGYLADDLFDYWLEPVVAGTLMRLKAIPDQPFSDPAGSIYYGQRFGALCNNARVEGNIGRVVGSMQTKPRPFL
jgi:hypothetical protein